MTKKCKILLIGGTGEAVFLNAALFPMKDIHLITSLAGVTKDPVKLKGEVLSGGFSSLGGLDAFLTRKNMDMVIDASHPFAVEISRKANQICQELDLPYMRFERKPWKKGLQDNWIEAEDIIDATNKLGAFDRIFLTIGRQELGPFEKIEQKTFIVRSIEDFTFAPRQSHVFHIKDRGPFTKEEEIALMKKHNIDVVVSKNSGGSSTYAKIEAAQYLSLPVIMVRRPASPNNDALHELDDLLEKIRLSF